ncbi:protein ACCELERATED CELL DEATH 6-like [Prosopis cineraria]|uniref:protein ACCELERATED CELL DEATH 6-like n=1 Tax=Prosopis cineraria TaxID=364024 RepID=UPI00240FCF13|nr:protein ACCELERATED CELL DEATH 6-like [Prosopis cineraria]
MRNKHENTALHEAVVTNIVDVARHLFATDEVVAYFLNKERKSPLHLVLEKGKNEVAEFMLQAPFLNREKHQGSSPLHAVILSGSTVDLLNELVEKRPKLIYMRDQRGGMPLHYAASIGYLEGACTITSASPESALERNIKGHLPIHIASKKCHVNMVKELFQQRWFDFMDLLNQKGQNILHIAAKSGKHEVVKEKLNVNFVNNKGMTTCDIVLQRKNIPPTFREYLSFAILRSAGVPLSEKGRIIKRLHAEQPQIEWIKDLVSTSLLVAILVATVTFTAGFTMLGGVYSSDDIDTKRRGMATLLNRKMFQLFTICDTISIYIDDVNCIHGCSTSSSEQSYLARWHCDGYWNHLPFDVFGYLSGVALLWCDCGKLRSSPFFHPFVLMMLDMNAWGGGLEQTRDLDYCFLTVDGDLDFL